MNKPLSLKLTSCFLFLILLAIGFRLADTKYLWTDELYSQAVSVSELSYSDIMRGKVPEGNACPLFYIIQKAISDVAGVSTFTRLDSLRGYKWDQYAQIVLRINPILFMSLCIAIIFYYFARFHSLLAGLYSLAVSLSSNMVWLYWAEARPYALWFFLATLQSLLFLFIMKKEKFCSKAWICLTVTHVLFSLTVVLSLGQIFFVSLLLWIFKERRWQRYVLLTLLPMAIGVFYFTRTPKYSYYFAGEVLQLIYTCVSKEWMLIWIIYALALLAFCCQKRTKFVTIYKYSAQWQGMVYFMFTCLMVVLTCAVIGYFNLRAPQIQKGFAVPARFFMFLTPVGIIAVTLFSIDLVRACRRNVWALTNVAIGLGGLLIINFLRNCFWVIGLY